MPSSVSTSTTYSPSVLDAISRGRVGHNRNSSLVSKAVLDQGAVVALLANAGISVLSPVSRQAVVREDFAHISYTFDPKIAKDPLSRLDIRIAQVKDNNDQALTMMKQYISYFDGDITQCVKPTPKPYGDCSLQTAYNVFWTHSRHMLNISCTSTMPGIEVLNKIAAEFNQALTKADIQPSSLVYPVLKLATPVPITTRKGEIFSIKLASVTDLDPVTYLRMENPGSIMQTKPSSGDGAYELIVREPNSSKVTIVVAHRQYLTVGKIEAQIIVTQPPRQGG